MINGLSEFIIQTITAFDVPAFNIFNAGFGVLMGASIGSFADATAGRTIAGHKWWGRERSRCDSCGRQLAAVELIPIISWLIQGGRCRSCKSAIPAECLYTELLGAILCCLLWGFHEPLTIPWITGTIVLPMFMVHAITDHKTKYVFDWVTIAIFITGCIIRCCCTYLKNGYGFAMGDLISLAICISFIPAVLLGWFGDGDLMLLAALAALLGPHGLTASIYIGVTLGFLYACANILYKLSAGKGMLRDRTVAFCPWLCMGAYIWILFFMKL